MKHIGALGRNYNVLVLEESDFNQTLDMHQFCNPNIVLKERLRTTEAKCFELFDDLVYRKD